MTALTNSVVITRSPAICLSSGALKSADHSVEPISSAFSYKRTQRSSTHRRALTIQASYRDGGGPNSASIFVGGFVLGGLIVGALGCVYAPQISKALTGAPRKDLMRKLPKFIYDEEKVVEKQRKKLTEKIEQLNLALDNVSNQFQSEESPNGAVLNSDQLAQ